MKNLPTRILLTCAAIGVASGILLLPILGVFSTAVVAAAPLAYAALIGTWFFGGVLIQTITHRPGVALITSFIAGLVIAPLTPYGFSTVASTVTVGVIQELPFLATLYRKWPSWLFYVTNGAVGVLYAFPAQRLLDVAAHEGVRLAMYPIAGGSAVLFTWIARLVAHRLDKTGVTRGLRGEIGLRRVRDAA
ncbi:MAG: ECF transporter S component [Microbacteriaceae bacterium]